MEGVEVISRGPDDTRDIGRILGERAMPGHVFLLFGDLGAGKTCLTQGILWGLGGDEYARSPTFVLIAQYHGRLTLHHIDLYRVSGPDQTVALGLDEYLDGDGLCVVEWADRAPELFGEQHLQIRISGLSDKRRRLALVDRTGGYAEILAAVGAKFAPR